MEVPYPKCRALRDLVKGAVNDGGIVRKGEAVLAQVEGDSPELAAVLASSGALLGVAISLVDEAVLKLSDIPADILEVAVAILETIESVAPEERQDVAHSGDAA